MIGECGRELTELMAVARENVALIADAGAPAPAVRPTRDHGTRETMISSSVNASAAPRAQLRRAAKECAALRRCAGRRRALSGRAGRRRQAPPRGETLEGADRRIAGGARTERRGRRSDAPGRRRGGGCRCSAPAALARGFRVQVAAAACYLRRPFARADRRCPSPSNSNPSPPPPTCARRCGRSAPRPGPRRASSPTPPPRPRTAR